MSRLHVESCIVSTTLASVRKSSTEKYFEYNSYHQNRLKVADFIAIYRSINCVINRDKIVQTGDFDDVGTVLKNRSRK
jgi:hypothetical protein